MLKYIMPSIVLVQANSCVAYHVSQIEIHASLFETARNARAALLSSKGSSSHSGTTPVN